MFSLRYRHNTNEFTTSTKDDAFPPKTEKQLEISRLVEDDTKLKPSVIPFYPYPIQFAFLFFVALFVRVWHADTPQFITQGELVQAQQINWMLKGQFYIGRAPPLTTMVYAWWAHIAGYRGNEDILYAGQMLQDFPLTSLRHITIIISSFTIPAIYMLARILGRTPTCSFFISCLLAAENSMVVQSRYLSENTLLMLLGTLACCSFFSTGGMSSQRHSWWTGMLLGGMICTKWQGGLMIVFFMLVFIYESWQKLCDPMTSMKKTFRFISLYSFSLVVIPFSIYIALFKWHFHQEGSAGYHDLFLGSALRYSLQGNDFDPIQQSVAYGSHVVLKHTGTNTGYLHSDDKIFSSGSKQHRATVYPFEDMNNIWVIQKLDRKTYQGDTVEYLRNNDVFKLEHYASIRKLHSHDHKAPIHTSDGFYEVTTYGDPTVADDGNDLWWIRIVEEDGGYNTTNEDPVQALTTKVRLLHQRGCYLSSHFEPLLANDGAQQEVTCMNSAKATVSSWVFEYAHHPKLEGVSPMIQYTPPTFLQKLKEVHYLMANYKKVVYDRMSSLSPDEKDDLETMMDSDEEPRPWAWLQKSYVHIIWDDLTGQSVYVVLHPLLRRLTLLTLMLFPVMACASALFAQLRWSRSSTWCQLFWSSKKIQTAVVMLTGVVVHTFGLYVWPPHIVTMSDLSPCMMFGSIAFGCLLEWLTFPSSLSSSSCSLSYSHHHLHKSRIYLMTLLMVVCLGQFVSFDRTSPWTSGQCEQFQFANMDCDKYPAIPSQIMSTHTTVTLIHPFSQQQQQERNAQNEIDLDKQEQEEEDDAYENNRVMMPGKTIRFEYERGQEIRAEMEIARMRETAYRDAMANLTHPAFRYVRATYTPGPTLDQVTERRHQMHLKMLAAEGISMEEIEERLEKKLKKEKKKNKKKKNKKKNKKNKKKKVNNDETVMEQLS